MNEVNTTATVQNVEPAGTWSVFAIIIAIIALIFWAVVMWGIFKWARKQ